MKVKKNTLRLLACLVWGMAGLNVLRHSGLAPEGVIAVFYTGLGAALLLAGMLFGWNKGSAHTGRFRSKGGE